jgi:hypothetical protein
MKALSTLLMIVLLYACSSQSSIINPGENEGEKDNSGEWLIPREQVFDGGPGKDGIPSIDLPQFVPGVSVDYIRDDDLVIAVTFGSIIKVYPHSILDWHEIVNDGIDEKVFALTYCPLTGTAINWDRSSAANGTTFGVSGLLYNSNLIPYDRVTNSHWSQMRLDCVNGILIESKIETLPVLETTWQTIKSLPNLMVMSEETGFSRNYGTYPYGDYRTNHNKIIFPVSYTDSRREAKERVLGLIASDDVKVYSFDAFAGDTIKMVQDSHDEKQLIVVGNEQMNFITAFYVEDNSAYSILKGQFPDVLEDQEGNTVNVFGQVVSGPNKGAFLKQPDCFMSYWFALAAFYPDLEIYE